MADTKISGLTALIGANVASDDLLVIVDTDATETKSIRADELFNYINSLIEIKRTIVSVTATDASYAPTSSYETIELDNAGADIALTYASAIPAGYSVVIHATNNGAVSHTVKLASGQTFDGTNNTATFDAADDRIQIESLSATRVLIVYNNSVTFSST